MLLSSKIKTAFFVPLLVLAISISARAQWLSTSLSQNVVVWCFATEGQTLFAGGHETIFSEDKACIYRTTNEGTTWTNTNLPSNFLHVWDLYVTGQNLYAIDDSNIFLSTNLGGGWSNLGPVPAGNLRSISAIGSVLFVGTQSNGIFRSTDNGTTWTAVNNGVANNASIPTLLTVGNWVFATDNLNGGIFRSTDSGNSWTPTYNGFGTAPGIWNLMLFGSRIYASSFPLGAFVSDDTGASWHPMNTGLPSATMSGGPYSMVSNCSYIFAEGNWGIYGTGLLDTVWKSYNFDLPFDSPIALGELDGTLFAGLNSGSVWALPLNISLNIDSLNLSASPNGTVSFPVFASSTAPLSGDTVVFRIALHTDLLTPESVSSPLPGISVVSYSVDTGGLWVTLLLPMNYTIPTDTVIANITCRAYVTDTNATGISLSQISVSNVLPSCLSSSPAGGASFSLIDTCGDQTMIDMLGHSSFDRIEIMPNPATTVLTVKGSTGPLSISDALGRIYLVPQTATTLDISSLPAGMYFVNDGTSGSTFIKQ